ncbi:MAG TPA: hypothetical protein VGC63_04895 [Solirubrobacterales bacterium]|jgi:hypothetical protein
MAQKIIDLDAAVPENLGVKCGGVVYDIPGDIPIPDYIEIERLVEALNDPEAEGSGQERLSELYDRVLELFRVKQPDLEELPIGPRRLGVLVVSLYSGGAEVEDDEKRPTRASTPSTKKTPRKKSPGSKR